MTWIKIDLDKYDADSRNCIEVDLSDFDDEVCEYVTGHYDIDLTDDFDSQVVAHVRDNYDIELSEMNGHTTHFIFNCKNLADEYLIKDIIEKHNLERLLV